MPKNAAPWLTQYPEGVPHTIDPDAYSSIQQLFDESLQKFADRRLSTCMGVSLTYRQVGEQARNFAAWLQANTPQDEHIALMVPNLHQFPICMMGILMAGRVCVNVNPLYTSAELKHQLNDSGAKTIVILENFGGTLAPILQETGIERVIITKMGDLLGTAKGLLVNFVVKHVKKLSPDFTLPATTKNGSALTIRRFKEVMSLASTLPFTASEKTNRREEIAFLQYTGGTTGLSKGAMLTHRNVIAAVLQADVWFAVGMKKIKDGQIPNSIAALPLYHIFALTLFLLFLRRGGELTLIPNPRDIPGFIKVLKQRPFHVLPAVNTLFNALLMHPEFKTIDFSSLCISQAGGMAATKGTAEEWQRVTGCFMAEGWGMSETLAIGTNNPLNNTAFNGTIGVPLPSIHMTCKDDNGQSLGVGEIGEICIKGPNVTHGYFQKEAENKNAFTQDGYFRTGDLGFMDPNGYFTIVDRKKDMVLVSGFNVFPSELENALSQCPGVLEVAVVGVADAKTGEAIKAFVVRKDPALTEETVIAFCRTQLTSYKIPKYIEFRESLPKTNVGKILRRALREA